ERPDLRVRVDDLDHHEGADRDDHCPEHALPARAALAVLVDGVVFVRQPRPRVVDPRARDAAPTRVFAGFDRPGFVGGNALVDQGVGPSRQHARPDSTSCFTPGRPRAPGDRDGSVADTREVEDLAQRQRAAFVLPAVRLATGATVEDHLASGDSHADGDQCALLTTTPNMHVRPPCLITRLPTTGALSAFAAAN